VFTTSHWVLELIGWVLGAGVVTTTIIWAAVWYGVEYSMRTIPTLRRGQRLAASDPPTGRLCVVIPAHNESRVITDCIRALRNETYPQMRVVLALDRCSDDTAAIARSVIAGDERFEIIEIDSCPDGWAGKVHAVHTGVARSRAAPDAEYLLFADADTVFERGCIGASLALMRERRLGLLSALSTLTYDRWFERVTQMATGFELLRQYPLTRANGLKGQRAFANGQYMLFKRDAYDAVGGHGAVKAALLEDLALARLVARSQREVGVFLADGLLRCRMYADWVSFRRGWKRIYTEAANRKVAVLTLAAWRIRLLGTVFPVMTLVCGPYAIWLLMQGIGLGHGWVLLGFWAVGMVVWLGTVVRLAQVAHAPVWTAPLHIIGAWQTGTLLNEAADDLRSRRLTHWGGREYDLGAELAAPRLTVDDRGPTTEATI
jgi:GT2 family glycosyltransferase